jgi:hypothetical protein
MGNRYTKRLSDVRSGLDRENEQLKEETLSAQQGADADSSQLETKMKISEGINSLEGVRQLGEFAESAKSLYKLSGTAEGQEAMAQLQRGAGAAKDAVTGAAGSVKDAASSAAGSVKSALSSTPSGPDPGAPQGQEMTDFASEATPSSAPPASVTESTASVAPSDVPETATGGVSTDAGSATSEGAEAGLKATAEEEGGSFLKKNAGKIMGAATEGIGGGLQVGMGISADLHGGFHNMNTAQKIGNVSNIAGGSMEMIGAGLMFVNPVLGGAVELGGDLLSLFGSGADAAGDAKKTKEEQQEQQEKAQAQKESDEERQEALSTQTAGAASSAQTGTASAGQISAQKTIQSSGSF